MARVVGGTLPVPVAVGGAAAAHNHGKLESLPALPCWGREQMRAGPAHNP